MLFDDDGRTLTLMAMKVCGVTEEGQAPDEAELGRIVPLVAREDTLAGTIRVVEEHYGLTLPRPSWPVRLLGRVIDLGCKALNYYPDYCKRP